MPRPKRNKHENTASVVEETVSDAVAIEEVVETKREKTAEELLHEKAIRDSLDSEKQKKDVLIRTVVELEESIKSLSTQRDSLAMEYNVKRQMLDDLAKNIKAANYELVNIKHLFDERNQKMMVELNKRQKDVDSADATLQSLIRSNRETEKAINAEKHALQMEREQGRQRVHAAEVDLAQVNSNWKKAEADILKRESELKSAIAEFEAYKDSLKPEIARITEIKNENSLLLQKIERDKHQLEHMKLTVERERKAIQESSILKDNELKQMKLKVANEEARLRKWEQDMKDQALELQAKESEMARVIRRYKLESELAKDKQNAE